MFLNFRTFSLAYELVDKLKHAQPSLGITSADHICTSIAALLHDVGHGPFSHLFDGEFAKRCGKSFKHEEMSVKIIDRILRKPEIREALEPILSPESYESSIRFIQELISAKPFVFQECESFKSLSDEEKKEVQWSALEKCKFFLFRQSKRSGEQWFRVVEPTNPSCTTLSLTRTADMTSTKWTTC